jgi:hypothetical protein
VETEGPQTNEGRPKAPAESNVVRLRDWIGPYEELVPLGPRARSREPASPIASLEPGTSVADASQPPATPTPMPEAPPAAADFWGERSAAVHDALSAPDELWAPTPNGRSAGTAARRRIPPPMRPYARGLAPACAWVVRAAAATRRRALIAGAAAALVFVAVALAIAATSRAPAGAVHKSVSAEATDDNPTLHPNAAAATAILGLARTTSRKPNRGRGTPHHARPPAQHTSGPPAQHTSGSPATLARTNERPAPSTTAMPAGVGTPEYTGAPSSSRSSSADSSTYTPPPAPGESHATGPGSAAPSSGAGSKSASPSTATLRSLVTGAGQCSC